MERYIADEYRQIAAEANDDAEIAQGVVYNLRRACQYLWYLSNYTQDIASPDPLPGQKGKSFDYLLEAEFEDMELLGKIISIYDADNKLASWLKIDKLRYFYENFNAASGKGRAA